MLAIEILIRVSLLAQASGAPLEHVWASVQAERPGITAELLLAQAWKESRWTTDAVSRGEERDGARSRGLGRWPRERKFPRYFRPPYFCGASQLRRVTEKSCRAIGDDLQANYLEAAEHIQEWIVLCARMGKGKKNLSCALAGYGGGVKATRFKGRAWRYGQHTQAIARSYIKSLTVKRPPS